VKTRVAYPDLVSCVDHPGGKFKFTWAATGATECPKVLALQIENPNLSMASIEDENFTIENANVRNDCELLSRHPDIHSDGQYHLVVCTRVSLDLLKPKGNC
jgi:hypothetical protein